MRRYLSFATSLVAFARSYVLHDADTALHAEAVTARFAPVVTEAA